MSLHRSISQAFSLLSRKHKVLLLGAVVGQGALSLMDLVAVGLLGIVAWLLVSGGSAQSSSPFAVASSLFHSEALLPRELALRLGVIAGAVLVCKSLASWMFTRRLFRFLAARQAELAVTISRQITRQDVSALARLSAQNSSYAVTIGVNAITLGILGQGTVLAAELSLMVVLSVGLALVDPLVTLFTVTFFVSLGVLLHYGVSSTVSRWSVESAENQVRSAQLISDLVLGFREISVGDHQEFFVSRFAALRRRYSLLQADLLVTGQVAKYVFEVAIVAGAAFLIAFQLLAEDAAAAAATVALFLTASTRLMPSLLRLQSAALLIRSNRGIAGPTFALLESLRDTEVLHKPDESGASAKLGRAELQSSGYPGLVPTVVCDRLRIRLGASGPVILDNISFSIKAGGSLAIVGPTGAGKTTLVDALLGLLQPTSGYVSISGLSPKIATSRWPGGVAYVPQETRLVRGTVADNVALGVPSELIDEDRIWQILELVELKAQILSRNGLSEDVGELGARLSGGQRQRLSLARALYTQPKLLVLDEATSALDAKTEDSITLALEALKGDTTLIMIAHRPKTMQFCDQVLALEHGRVRAYGTLDEVQDHLLH